MYELLADNVDKVMGYCLFHKGESTDGMVEVTGVVSDYGFHPGRLAEKKQEIIKMLGELPENFNIDSVGKGWSFLQACEDKHGRQWGQHRDMEALFVLGIAIDRVMWLLPKVLWANLPGGMPYCAIYNSDIKKKGE
jgi:hypothetical protein